MPTIDKLLVALATLPDQSSEQPVRGLLNGADLLLMEFPDPQWLVEGLLPVGLTILAGPPKRGKSWLALELALAVCSDGYFLNRKVQSGRVLYCALEDSKRRLQSRLLKQGWSAEAAQNLDILTGSEFARLFGDKDGAKRFYDFIAGYVLVVIDTLSRAFRVRDWNDLAGVTSVLAPLQEAVAESGVSLIAIDHHRKPNGLNADPIVDVIGTTAKGAVADTVVGLYKEQGKPGAKLLVTGRDIDELEIDIRFDPSIGCWVESDKSDGLTVIQRETLEVISSLEGGASLNELVELTGRNRGTLYRELVAMLDKGLIRKEGTRYKIDGNQSNLSNLGNLSNLSNLGN